MNPTSSNYRQSELEKFDSIADEWWNPDGSLKTLHALNPVRLRYITSVVKLNGQRVLDVGCGGGLLTEALAAASASVTGIDASATAIRIATDHLAVSKLQIDYVATTVEQFEMEGRQPFDVITCMEMLEHVPDPVAVVESMMRLLKPGGHLFLSTINRNPLAWLQTIVIAERLLGLVPADTHEYAQYIRPSELSRWLRNAGMQIIDISGMGYLPGFNYAFRRSSPAVNYLLYAIKPA